MACVKNARTLTKTIVEFHQSILSATIGGAPTLRTADPLRRGRSADVQPHGRLQAMFSAEVANQLRVAAQRRRRERERELAGAVENFRAVLLRGRGIKNWQVKRST